MLPLRATQGSLEHNTQTGSQQSRNVFWASPRAPGAAPIQWRGGGCFSRGWGGGGTLTVHAQAVLVSGTWRRPPKDCSKEA